MLEDNKTWREVQEKIFPQIVPNQCIWEDRNAIVEVLNLIGKMSMNHMFFPISGGNDLMGASLSHIENCIELYTSTSTKGYNLVKPKVLTFNSFPNYNFNYFRLEIAGIQPSGVYKDKYNVEEIVEIEKNKYIDRRYWDEGEYQEESLPQESRLQCRHLNEGAFAIVSKTSLYNRIKKPVDHYNGTHDKMTPDQFYEYIKQSYEAYERYLRR